MNLPWQEIWEQVRPVAAACGVLLTVVWVFWRRRRKTREDGRGRVLLGFGRWRRAGGARRGHGPDTADTGMIFRVATKSPEIFGMKAADGGWKGRVCRRPRDAGEKAHSLSQMTRELSGVRRGAQFADAMNEGTKTPVESRTLWGALALLLAWGLGQLGVQEEAARISAELARAEEAVRALLAAGGFFLTVWGRFTARKRISLSGQDEG